MGWVDERLSDAGVYLGANMYAVNGAVPRTPGSAEAKLYAALSIKSANSPTTHSVNHTHERKHVRTFLVWFAFTLKLQRECNF